MLLDAVNIQLIVRQHLSPTVGPNEDSSRYLRNRIFLLLQLDFHTIDQLDEERHCLEQQTKVHCRYYRLVLSNMDKSHFLSYSLDRIVIHLN